MKIKRIITRFIIVFVLVLFVSNYINCSFWLMGGSAFAFKEVFGFSMILTLPLMPMVIDLDGVF